MATPTIARSGQESTDQAVKERVLRGLNLFRERSEEIEPLGHGRYSVPSCTTDETYEVDLGIMSGEQSCSCPDFSEFARVGICKHLVACELYRCKIQRPRWHRQQAESAERRRRDLEHVGDVAERLLEGLANG